MSKCLLKAVECSLPVLCWFLSSCKDEKPEIDWSLVKKVEDAPADPDKPATPKSLVDTMMQELDNLVLVFEQIDSGEISQEDAENKVEKIKTTIEASQKKFKKLSDSGVIEDDDPLYQEVGPKLQELWLKIYSLKTKLDLAGKLSPKLKELLKD
eukprot:Seg16070.3 transcript_id=Seg16070.3/GoldUCD/mRNA.D3Y31 product="hypothetical protein" protein_id=Seg16070.3/GoldUCD/D3Y31